MFKKWAAAIATATVLAVGSSGPAFAQLGGVGDAVKSAGKATVEGAKKGVAKAGEVTKDAASETKKAVEGTKDAVTAPTVKRPSDAPANARAQCHDGTYTKQHTGACTHHQGVKTWFK